MSSGFLRSPPFPGIAPETAAIGWTAARDSGDQVPENIVASLLAGRVGGAFWLPPLSLRDEVVRTVLRPRDDSDLKRMLASVDPTTTVAMIDDQVSESVRTHAGEADPWSLPTAARLICHGDDEWAAVAAMIGAPIEIVSAGRYAEPGDDAAAILSRLSALLARARYRDPFTGQATDILQAIAILAEWRRQIDGNRTIRVAAGMAFWKRDAIDRLLWSPRDRKLAFERRTGAALRVAAARRGAIAAWPSRIPPALIVRARAAGVPIAYVEDGFVRSVGLGSNLVPPLSVAVDHQGIHYDPSSPSDLETLLAEHPFPPELLSRAAALRQLIVEHGVSKYGGTAGELPLRGERRIVLVAGQVEDDMSVRLGGGEVRGNLDLLARARRVEPDAEIWFRPHPDVDMGHRRGAVSDEDTLRYADRIIRGGAIATILDHVDGVHVLTSLTGFEALLRGREVTIHGTPFFAGWGLTRDLGTVPDRRGRQLGLDALVAATLILYPRYVDPRTGLLCSPEVLVRRLIEAPAPRPSGLMRARMLQGRLQRWSDALKRRLLRPRQDQVRH